MIFDNDPDKIGKKIGDFTVLDVAEMVDRIREAGVKVAMVATPASHAQEVTDKLVEAGVKAVLNYAPIRVTAPPDVQLQYIDPATHLQRMSYYLG
jgi:redox-sensing transcriptional repressor